MRRLLLVRHAPTVSTRAGRFPDDEPLDGPGLAEAARLAESLPAGCEVITSPALRCRQTAQAAGLRARPDAVLAECDFGSWAGSTLAEVHVGAPAEAGDWMTDPGAAPHGGESLSAFCQRIATWLDHEVGHHGATTAITHGGVIKAAVTHALDAPILAFWRIEVAPMSITELHGYDDGWRLARVNCPLGMVT